MRISLCLAFLTLACVPPAARAQDFITGTSTATEILDPGPLQGWYRYDLSLSWDFTQAGQGTGLSHWDMMVPLCAENAAFDVFFPDPAGTSTSEQSPLNAAAVLWFGEYLPEGDPVFDPPVITPVIKYDQVLDQVEDAGAEGFGSFSFIMNSAPLEAQTHVGALGAKYGTSTIMGDLTGEFPDCENVVPEPATLGLLAAGLVVLARRRRRP